MASSSSSVRLLAFWSAVVCVLVCVSSVDLTLKSEEEEELECYGTAVGFGYSGTLEMHYNNLVKRYSGCTYVLHNLEITNLVDPNINYDLSFLKNIRYVQGYVLFGLITEVDVIPLDNLEIIRGNTTFYLMDDEYSLVVSLTARQDEEGDEEVSGLKEIHMPKLKEISEGKVLFTQNPLLGYVNTIDWTSIVKGDLSAVHFLENANDETVASIDDFSICASGSRWGDSFRLCQPETYNSTECHKDCKGRCFGPGEDQCCHNSCAVGCTGTEDDQCLNCKDYFYEDQCVGFCPAKSYPMLQKCVPY